VKRPKIAYNADICADVLHWARKGYAMTSTSHENSIAHKIFVKYNLDQLPDRKTISAIIKRQGPLKRAEVRL